MAESLMSEAISGPTRQVHYLRRVSFDKLLREEWFQCRDNINLIILALKSFTNQTWEHCVYVSFWRPDRHFKGHLSHTKFLAVCRVKTVPVLVQSREPALHSKHSTDRASPAAVNYLLYCRVRLPLNFCFGFDANFPLALAWLALGRKLVSFVCLNISRKWPSSDSLSLLIALLIDLIPLHVLLFENHVTILIGYLILSLEGDRVNRSSIGGTK